MLKEGYIPGPLGCRKNSESTYVQGCDKKKMLLLRVSWSFSQYSEVPSHDFYMSGVATEEIIIFVLFLSELVLSESWNQLPSLDDWIFNQLGFSTSSLLQTASDPQSSETLNDTCV